MSNSIIFNLFNGIPANPKSHPRGWCTIWSQRLDNAYIAKKTTRARHYDKIYLDHGVNFSGSINLFGGLGDDVVDKIEDLIEAHENLCEIVSLDYESSYLAYIPQLTKRLGAKSTSTRFNKNHLIKLDSIFKNMKCLKQEDLKLDSFIYGDSHSPAYSTKDQKVLKRNGLLLHGLLGSGIKERLKTFNLKGIKKVTLCFGSIDIRFHVLTHKINPIEFAKGYLKQVNEARELGIEIEVCAPVPIEHEDRKIPNTGKYNGQPFFGTRKERLSFTKRFINELSRNKYGIKVVVPPISWYMMDGKRYADEIMELSSSVHISPEKYNSTIGWKNV